MSIEKKILEKKYFYEREDISPEQLERSFEQGFFWETHVFNELTRTGWFCKIPDHELSYNTKHQGDIVCYKIATGKSFRVHVKSGELGALFWENDYHINHPTEKDVMVCCNSKGIVGAIFLKEAKFSKPFSSRQVGKLALNYSENILLDFYEVFR